jgi:hypothetical protein
LREAVRGDADADVDRILAALDLDRLDLVGLADEAFAEREAHRVVFEIRGRGEHHDVRHAVIDERDGNLFRDAVDGRRGVAALPPLDGNLDARCVIHVTRA